MAIGNAVNEQRHGRAWARFVILVPVFLVLIVFGLRVAGFRDGPRTPELKVQTNGPGGAADLMASASSNPADAEAVNALSNAGAQACKHSSGVLKEVLGFRGPTAVFLTEITGEPRRVAGRFRWDCRLHVLRLADQ